MSEGLLPHSPERAPIHLWVVGLFLALWNGWGVALAIAAQSSRLPIEDPAISAYFGSQPLWFVLIADIAPVAGVAGAVALLLQSRWAARLFALQIGVLVITNLYEVAIGTSLLLTNENSRVTSVVLAVLLCLQIAYARWMARRGVLY